MSGLQLVLTGGGTGGHIYPALEVGRVAAERGATLRYVGSLRGQEGKACSDRGIPFLGFGSQPLYSLRTPRGWRSLAALLKARASVRREFMSRRPDAVFSTGGYSAGPVVSAARSLRIPYFIHEANSIPGRTNRLYAPQARAFTCLFKTTLDKVPELKPVRVGQPIRPELREAAVELQRAEPPLVFVFGGSQGARSVNQAVLELAKQDRFKSLQWLHVAGPANFDEVSSAAAGLNNYVVKPYLEGPEMALAYQRASVVISRSGGSLAEIAVFRLPSILIPLPTSADNHQWHNAKEFADMGAATLVEQGKDLGQALTDWIEDNLLRSVAATKLAEWDLPDATIRIVELIEGSAKK